MIKITNTITGEVKEYPATDSNLHFIGFLDRNVYKIEWADGRES